MKKRNIQEDTEYAKNQANTEHWKLFKWLWDKLDTCPHVDNVSDVDFRFGTVKLISKEGDEYTITLNKQDWRQL